MEDFDKNSESSPLINDSGETAGKNYVHGRSRESQTSLLSIAEVNHIKKRTIRVLYFNMFIGSISFSIVMASLWPFLRKLDDTVNETFLGWVNAGYSFAQMVASLVMGYWCQKRRAIEPIVASIIFLAAGSALYSYAEAFGKKGIWVVLGGRIILGLSAGSVSVARAVGAQLSDNEGRAKVMAYLALWQATGFFIGPALQALSKPIGTQGVYYAPMKLYLNIYTVPGYMMIILSIINVVVVFLYFVEDADDSRTKFRKHVKQLTRQSSLLEPIDTPIVIVCIAFWFVAMTIFALNETIIAPIVMNEYGWTRDQTVFYTSIILVVAGVIAVVIFMFIAPLAKRFGERALILSGYLIMLAGFIFYLPWGPGYPKIRMKALTNATVVTGADVLESVTSSFSGGGGCPYEYSWCHTMPQLSFWQFLIGATLVGIGYPVTAVILNTLYSKVLGPIPQGKYMGIFSAVGSFARVIGPLYVTAIYQHFGMRWTAASVDILLILTIVLLVVSWRRLLPYGYKKRNLLFAVNEA